jgi:small subunit ribosomal protein S17
MSRPHGIRRRIQGRVVSAKTAKTIVVEVVRRVRHPKYGKMVRQDRRLHAHDEAQEARLGDTVELVECRPMSRTKSWRLLRVVQRSLELTPVDTVPGAVGPAEPAQ